MQEIRTSENRRIVIVGAGIAGLNAALTLHDAGLPCTIYEAANYIGGRMHSDSTTWAEGMATDICGEFIDYNHYTVLKLIKRFGLTAINLNQAMTQDSEPLTFFAGKYSSSNRMYSYPRWFSRLLQEQIQQVGYPTTYNSYTETGYRLDHISVYDWIEQYVRDGHRSALGMQLDMICRGIYGMESSEQSSLNLLYFIGALPHSKDAENYDENGDENESHEAEDWKRYKIMGGNQQLPLAIARTLPKESIKLNHRLIAIKRESDNTITLTFVTPNTGSTISVACDIVVLTLPFSVLRHLDYAQAGFDALKARAISELGYGTNSKLFLQFDTRYWQQPGPWPRHRSDFIITDLPIQVLWDTSVGQSGTSGILVDYTSGATGKAYAPPAPYTTTNDSPLIQEYAQRCLEHLERVLPGISAQYTGLAALSYPTGDPNLLGSYSCWRVGQYTGFCGYERVRQGNIFFAGEHCSVTAQGYMEGGAAEGARAAKDVLRDFGIVKR
jgi:monoamine oxidase